MEEQNEELQGSCTRQVSDPIVLKVFLKSGSAGVNSNLRLDPRQPPVAV